MIGYKGIQKKINVGKTQRRQQQDNIDEYSRSMELGTTGADSLKF